MEVKIKAFNGLSLNELYDILALRNEVFIVEQNCVYQDIDSKDQKALHVLLYEGSSLAAYARLFDKGIAYDTAAIGRVIVAPAYRNRALGDLLVDEAIRAIETHYKTMSITISAQAHLQRFYGKHEFVTVSEEYLEDDIPHVKMKRN